MAIKIPGKAAGLVLGIVGLLTVVFPIISLTCSITGLTQARKAKKFVMNNGINSDPLVNTALFLNLFSMIGTVAIMIYSIPGAIERNLI